MSETNTELMSPSSTNDLIFNQTAMKSIMDLAGIMAKSSATIPAHLKNNVGDCFAIIMQASQWRMNPWAIAQKTHVVNGTLGYEAQLVNSVIVNNGPVTGRFNYEFFGNWEAILGKTKELESKTKTDEAGHPKKFRVPDWTFNDEKGLGVIVSNTIRGEDQPRELKLFLTQALTRNSTQWAEDPQQQLSYLAVKKWARRYCPDVIMGVYSGDELQEITPDGYAIDERSEYIPKGEADSVPTFDGMMAKIMSNPTDNFDWIDVKALKQYFANEQLAQFRQACANRRKELSKATETKHEGPINQAATEKQGQADTDSPKSEQEYQTKGTANPDWKQLLGDATSPDELASVWASIPDNEKGAFKQDYDEAADFLRSVS